MLVSDFDYYLPERLIAQEPASRRDQSRLLVLDRPAGKLTDSTFRDLPRFVGKGELLVLNNTRVFPARLLGRRIRPGPQGKQVPGGHVEVFLIRQVEHLLWEALVRPGRALMPGARVEFADGQMFAEVVEWRDAGRRLVRFEAGDDFNAIVDRIGHTPLPPYIKRDEADRLDAERYQTVFARERGAVAAPTAGLHFTPALLEMLGRLGVETVEITHHVGYGTFQPVRVERVEDHHIEAEAYTIEKDAARRLNQALEERRRIIAVGTTTTRALESAALHSVMPGTGAPSGSPFRTETPRIEAGTAMTDLFIYPGFEFKVVGALITNFHLPRSSLLMLVAALAGRDFIFEAYRRAIERGYRFYSYGDAMLIL